MIPTQTMRSARPPSVASSLPTCPPTNSARFNSALESCAFNAFITASACACISLFWSEPCAAFLRGRRISTSCDVPNFVTEMSVWPILLSVSRMASGLASSL